MKKTSAQQKAIKIKPFMEVKQYWGLCACCNSAPTCTYPREFGRTILECDEFDGITPPLKRRIRRIDSRPQNRFSGIAPNAQNMGILTGLCAYCGGLKTCTYPKPEGGVWHCEEYC